MADNNCNMKGGAFFSATFNLLVGILTLGGAIYKISIKQNERMGLLVILFLMGILFIHNGVLLIIGIVMVNKEYVILYLVLNVVNWLVGTFIIIKEMSGKLTTLTYSGLSILLIVAWSIQVIVYIFYKQMCKPRFSDMEQEAKIVSSSS